LQSELVLQCPQVPPEHVPYPAQSDETLQYGSTGATSTPAGESNDTDAARRALSASNAGTGTVAILAS